MWVSIFSFNIKPLMSEKELSESEKERRKNLPPEAVRALEEADARRARAQALSAEKAAQKGEAKELGGPSGEEPTRYGDWERKGRCIDF